MVTAQTSRLSEFLGSTGQISEGGDSFRQWASDVVRATLEPVRVEYGELVVVPQLGHNAGDPLKTVFADFSTDACLNREDVAGRGSDLWRERSLESSSLDLECSHDQTHQRYIFAPIARGINRSIGFVAVAVEADLGKTVTASLELAAGVISIAVKAEKGSAAVRHLTTRVWSQQAGSVQNAQSIAATCRDALACSHVLVWISNPLNNAYLETIASYGNGGSDISAPMSTSNGVAGKCFSEGKTIVVDDLWDMDEIRLLGVDRLQNPALVREFGWRSAIFLPIDIGTEVAGVVGVYGPRPRGFSDFDISIAHAFTERLAAGHVHTRRIEQLEELEQRLFMEANAIEAGMTAMERVHDVDNNLTLAQGQLSMISGRFGRNENHAIKYEAQRASSFVDQAHIDIKDLVNGARIDRIRLTRFDLVALIRDIVQRFDFDAREHNIAFVLKLPRLLQVRLDRSRVTRILQNLIANSIEWLGSDSKSGRREIRIGLEVLQSSALRIQFSDNGPGIAPHHLDHVFDYFFTLRGEKGLGFGLPISRHMTQSLNGNISVTSTWGFETTFVVVLPIDARGQTQENVY